MSTDKVKSLRLQRRGAKAKFSRIGNALQSLIEKERPVAEVLELAKEYSVAFNELQCKHEAYSELIENDEEFSNEEVWMAECHGTYLEYSIKHRDYCQSDRVQNSEPAPVNETETTMSADEPDENHSEPVRRIPGPKYQMERPKLPTFDGDIREFCIFKADFLHAVGNRHEDMDALMILRSCLKNKPLELIRGIGHDYKAAWSQLEMIYGDDRFVADAIINDISKVKPLKDGDHEKFCDFVHLVRRSYNTLLEINQPGNMSNSHMLALMEKKLSPEDRLVWFRHQEAIGRATFELFLSWLTIELKSRLRASAPLRSESTGRSSVHLVGKPASNLETKDQRPFYKCWLCEASTHWIDQCRRFIGMTQGERLKLIKENQACFSCLKKTVNEHRMSNCKRRRQCIETNAGERCKHFHHPLLHASTEVRSANVDVAFAGNSEGLLPVVTAEIIGQQGAVCMGNVLLDSGSQLSLIKASVAEEMKLKGINLCIDIIKVGGGQDQMQTKQYKLKIRSLSTNAVHSVTAVEIPCISDDIAEIRLKELCKRFSLKDGDLRRGSGSIDLLLGVDHPKMHLGETREKGLLVARKSPLGWVIFGNPKRSMDRMNVLHVKLASPIDLTDFWTSESMGVQSSSCRCEPSPLSQQEKVEEQIIRESSRKIGNQWEISYPWREDPNQLPDNRAQAEKILCSTEKRLARNPDHAEVYEKLTDRWKEGPSFLYKPEEEWPSERAIPEAETEVVAEKGRVHHISAKLEDVIDVTSYSSWRRLIRVTAYVFKFIDKLKAAVRSSGTGKASLSTTELQRAELCLVKEAQIPLHKRLQQGDFKTLSPFVDSEGIIRVGGRLGKSQISYEQKHPALLPHGSWVSLLITRHMHQLGHGGVAATAAKTRRQYWILRIHKLAKTVKHRCVICRRMEHQVESQFMAELPDERVAPYTPPFYNSSVDYFGPISVKVGRNKTAKHYGVLFTCLNSRAVHLELAVDCSSMEFMQVLRRFFAVRGQPALLLSDNGTQFIGAERELREMVRGWSGDELREFCAEKGTTWKFITPSAPHHNGCAEALVKSCKVALKKAIGDQRMTPFELHTCLQEVANLINQRPIGRNPNDPDDGSYLCPNDLLLGRSSTNVPQGPFRETRNPRHRFEFVQRIVDGFWRSWMRDVFPLLVPRRKWNCERRNVRVDDVVLLSDQNAIRGKWTLGKVIQVYPGTDDKVRTVKVKSKDTEYNRPISKIVVIYPAEGYEE